MISDRFRPARLCLSLLALIFAASVATAADYTARNGGPSSKQMLARSSGPESGLAFFRPVLSGVLYRAGFHGGDKGRTGLNTAQREAYSDIVYFGTGGSYIADGGPRGAIFMSAPLSGLYLGENPEGRLDTYMWTRKLTAKQIVEVKKPGAGNLGRFWSGAITSP